MFRVTPIRRRGLMAGNQRGLTLIELMIAIGIIAILMAAVMPVARLRVKREKERELRRDLWEMRDPIDRFKDSADKGSFQIKVGTEGYPPDLEPLGNGLQAQGKKMRFLLLI